MRKLAPIPGDLLEYILSAKPPRAKSVSQDPEVELDQPSAIARAIDFLKRGAPLAIQGAGGDDTTFKVAAAVGDFGISEAMTLELMLDHWNERCEPPWPVDELATKVENADRFRTLPRGRLCAAAEFDPAPLLTKSLLRPLAALSWSPKRNYVVRDLLNFGMIGLITGVPNAGKSPLALDLAAHIAIGKPWQGRKVKQGLVVYIATEGWTAFDNRLEAIRREHFHDYPDPPFVQAPLHLNLRTPPKGFITSLIEETLSYSKHYQLPPALIVVDTLSPTLGGGTDRDDDVARAVIDNARQLCEGTGAALAFVHHPTKAADSDYRGSSVWIDDTDFLIKVDMDNRRDVRTVTTPRVKETAAIEPLSFRIRNVALGNDDEGDPIGTVVVDWLAGMEELDGFRSRGDDAALDAIEEAYSSDPAGIGYTDWMHAWAMEMGRVGKVGLEKGAKSEFNNTLARLRKEGLVERGRSKKWTRTSVSR
jgi:hypothetical protein